MEMGKWKRNMFHVLSTSRKVLVGAAVKLINAGVIYGNVCNSLFKIYEFKMRSLFMSTNQESTR